MKVLINGHGNIGSTLSLLLARYREMLGISEVWVHRRKITPWEQNTVNTYVHEGIKVCTSDSDDYPDFDEILNHTQFIFEATPNGVGLENKKRYEHLNQLQGAVAQGSEKGFGDSYMAGVNDDVIFGKQYVHVVSCNTHGSAAILRVFAGDKLEDLIHGDMVVVRRSEDIGNHQRLVSANVVARHLDEQIGTHHAVDVVDLFKTLDIPSNITSSDITTPSQLMHSVRFNIQLSSLNMDDIMKRISKNPLISTTETFDSNKIFEIGRRIGFAGRVYNHAIILTNNLLLDEKSKTVKGWAFIPQEGNTILSTLKAYLLQTKKENVNDIFNQLTSDLCQESW